MAYSQKKFLEDIARLERWIERRRAALDGVAQVKRIWIEPYTVRKHERGGHFRTVITMPAKKRRRR